MLRDLPHGLVQLRSAITTARAKHVTSQALAMHADQDGLLRVDFAADQSEVVCSVGQRAVQIKIEVAVIGRHAHTLFALHQFLAAPAVGDEITDGAHLQLVLAAELLQIVEPRHRTVFVEDLANHPRGIESGQTHQINCRLGVARALQDPTFPRLQGENVPGLSQVGRTALRSGQHADCLGTVPRTDPGSHTFCRIDRNREIGPVQFAVVRHHALQTELPRTRRGQRDANKTAAVFGHEIDCLGRHFARGHDQITFVLALGIIGHNDHLAGAHVLQNGLDGIKGGFAHGHSVKHPRTRWAMSAGGGRH